MLLFRSPRNTYVAQNVRCFKYFNGAALRKQKYTHRRPEENPLAQTTPCFAEPPHASAEALLRVDQYSKTLLTPAEAFAALAGRRRPWFGALFTKVRPVN